MSVNVPNVKQKTLAGVSTVLIPVQRGKKTRLKIESGGSTFTVNGYLLSTEEATKLGVTRQVSVLIASGTADIDDKVFDGGFIELEIDLTTFSSDLIAEIAQFTPAQST